ncbi:coiled-coil domain-containing protein 39-like, partial [Dendropsophus ebraccatus]|uniref:coiled-coil domain-containing protein 39-like n=1 Tax=Dendropsophus ebraccatus TaxID=150705 RepID=UPI00383187C6
LQRKQKEKMNLTNMIKEMEDRIQAMSDHLRNVRQEPELYPDSISFLSASFVCLRNVMLKPYVSSKGRAALAREKENESEEHFKTLAEREIGRLKQEIHRLENELVSLREKKNSQEELSLHIERLTVESNHKRKLLDNEMTETITTQHGLLSDYDAWQLYNEGEETECRIELDKAAEDFRTAHSERQQLIQQWENTIDQMQKRDREIDQCTLQLAQIKQELREKENVIKEKIQFLNSEIENNKEYEKKISNVERKAAKLRQDYQEQESIRSQLQDELDTLKGTVDRTATELEVLRIQVNNLKKDVRKKNERLSQAKDYNEGLAVKLKLVTDSALSMEERAQRIDEMLKEQETTVKDLEAQLKQIREQHFKKSQELHEHKTKEKHMISEINGSQVSLRNLNSQLQKLDLHALKQQGIIYNQDFQIQQLERRLARLKGEVNTDEKHALETKVSDLSKMFDERKAALNLLNSQHKKLQVSRCSYIKRELEKTGQEKENLISKMEELKLFNNMSDKALKKLRTSKTDLSYPAVQHSTSYIITEPTLLIIDKHNNSYAVRSTNCKFPITTCKCPQLTVCENSVQEFMVDDNILKLEIKRLRDMLHNKADDVFSLEKTQIAVGAAMKERTQEISIHKEMLKSQIRLADQERQTISQELHERIAKVDKMRKRFEIITVAMMPPEGEEEKSQAYYIIKAAQEKEELQRVGDELDAKIRKAEKEISALENTLQVINGCNNSYRKSFNKVTETSEEYEEKNQLEEQKKAAEEKYRYKRRQIKEIQEDIQIMKNTFDSMMKEETSYQEKVNEMLPCITQLNKETEDQKTKLERVMKQVNVHNVTGETCFIFCTEERCEFL